MSADYTELKENIDQIKEKLNACVKALEDVKPGETLKYENPQYRVWSENIKDLEKFTINLEEWLNQPLAAEAKRYLLGLKNWSESPEKISLEDIEKDWRFLSENLEEIKDIHKLVGDIEYERIKKKTSTWILNRITEKDIARAKKWANNSNKFADSLKQIENKKVESTLPEEVKKRTVDELLEVITSFDQDSEDKITRYRQLMEDAENIIRNKPAEIKEDAILNTAKSGKKIEEIVPVVDTKIRNIKTLLINLEWVKEFSNFEDYNKLWDGKQVAMKKDDLESIEKALEDIRKQSEQWKGTRRGEAKSICTRIKRMSKGIKANLREEVTALVGDLQDINWIKPDVKLLSDALSRADNLKGQLQEELRNKLKNEEAISLIENPEIIRDLGRGKDWDIEKFIQALKIVLDNGLIEIEMVKEK